jgi:hypothetical protein
MKACLLCESTSTADNGDLSTPQNNDVYWFLCQSSYLSSRTGGWNWIHGP